MMKKAFLTAGGGALILYLFYKSLWASLGAFLLLKPFASFWEKQDKKKEQRELLYQFRDLLFSLSGSLGSGHPMREALAEAEEDLALIYPENAPILREVGLMRRQLTEQQAGEEQVWQEFAARSGLEDVAGFAELYSICRRRGGDMESVIGRGAQVLMDKISIYREIHSLTVQKQWEARVLVLMPLIVLLFLQVTAADYMAVMYKTLTGRLIMTVSLLAMAAAYYWSMKLTDIDV